MAEIEDRDWQRFDKWLWCVRIFKSRTIAADACKAGKVKMNDVPLKPSHLVAIGDVVEVPPVIALIVATKQVSVETKKAAWSCMQDGITGSEHAKVRMTLAQDVKASNRNANAMPMSAPAHSLR